MIACKVGKHGGVEMNAVDPLQRQRMGGNFHGDVSSADALQSMENTKQVEGLGSSIQSRKNLSAQPVLDGADEGGGLAGMPQHGIDEKRGGGFAIGAGDSGQRQALIRTSIKVPRGGGQRAAPVGDTNPRTIEGRGRRQFAHDRYRSFFQGRCGKSAAIGMSAGKREEEISRFDAARVIFQTRDVRSAYLFRDVR